MQKKKKKLKFANGKLMKRVVTTAEPYTSLTCGSPESRDRKKKEENPKYWLRISQVSSSVTLCLGKLIWFLNICTGK